MKTKQEHQSSGDNVAGDKYMQSSYYATTGDSISSRIDKYKEFESIDFSDSLVIKAFKELIVDLIKDEQEKPHSIVPISRVRNHFKDKIEDHYFESTIKALNSEGSIHISNSQVCYIPKDLDYRIELY